MNPKATHTPSIKDNAAPAAVPAPVALHVGSPAQTTLRVPIGVGAAILPLDIVIAIVTEPPPSLN
jgi:hypothetical protein